MNIKEVKDQLYDSNQKDYYLIINQKNIYFSDIYDSIKKAEINAGDCFFEILVEEIAIKIKRIFTNFFKILLDGKKTIDIQSPKIIQIGNLERKCYNEYQLYSFFDEFNIDPLRIIFKKEKIQVGKILVLDEELVELELENEIDQKEEKYEIFKFESNNNNKILLSELIKGNKNYINFAKNSFYFMSNKRSDFLNSIFKGSFSKIKIMIYGPSGIGKTVSLLNYRFSRVNYVLYLNLDYLFSLENKKKFI